MGQHGQYKAIIVDNELDSRVSMVYGIAGGGTYYGLGGG